MMAADYRHIGGRENRLGRHYSRFSPFWPAPALAGQSLALRKLCDAGSNRRSRVSNKVALPRSDAAHHSRLSRYSPLGSHCVWDRRDGSRRTIPAAAQSAPSPPETPPACCPGVALKLTFADVSCLTSPPTHTRQSTPLQMISRSVATDFCRGSLTLIL